MAPAKSTYVNRKTKESAVAQQIRHRTSKAKSLRGRKRTPLVEVMAAVMSETIMKIGDEEHFKPIRIELSAVLYVQVQ